MANSAKPERFAYIDWMRGFACLLMFEVHGYDSWLTDSLRQTSFYKFSQFTGTIAATA
jgi:peptidoglycan/LPS O-acetylase OafA/YrhL